MFLSVKKLKHLKEIHKNYQTEKREVPGKTVELFMGKDHILLHDKCQVS